MNNTWSVFGWYTSSILITWIYRYLGKYELNGFITCLSMFLQSIIGMIASLSLFKFEINKNTFLVAGTQGAYILAANVALEYVPIHVAVTFKCLVPSLSVLFAKISNIEIPDSKVFFELFYITTGLFIANYSPDSLSDSFIFDKGTIIGTSIAFTAAVMSSLRYSAVSLSLIETPPREIVRDTCIFMGLMMSPVAVIQAGNADYFDVILIPGVVLVSTLGYLLSVNEYRVIHNSGVYHTSLFEVVKETGLILVSFFTESEYTFIKSLGIAIVVVSIVNAKINKN